MMDTIDITLISIVTDTIVKDPILGIKRLKKKMKKFKIRKKTRVVIALNFLLEKLTEINWYIDSRSKKENLFSLIEEMDKNQDNNEIQIISGILKWSFKYTYFDFYLKKITEGI